MRASPIPWLTADLKKNGLSNWSSSISSQILSSFFQTVKKPFDSVASLTTSLNGRAACAACAAAAAAAAATDGWPGGRAAPGAPPFTGGGSLAAAVAAAAAIVSVSGAGAAPASGTLAQPARTNGASAPKASVARVRRRYDMNEVSPVNLRKGPAAATSARSKTGQAAVSSPRNECGSAAVM